MGTARFQPEFQMGKSLILLQHPIVGDRFLGILGCDTHLLALQGIAPDGSIHPALRLLHAAIDHCLIHPVTAVGLDLLRQREMRLIGLCHQQQTAGIPVNAVHDSRADHTIDG